MKKSLSLLIVFITGIIFPAFAAKVEIKNAQLVARNFYYERVNHKTVTPYQSIIISSQYTEKFNNDAVYYAFSFNNSGFVLVSADDIVSPIIGYSFSGPYVTENQPENFAFWMQHYKNEIVYDRQQNFQPDDAISTAWNHLSTADPNNLTIYRSTTDVEPLLPNITWDQTFPWNAMCPADPAGPSGHVVVGCVATAMAQIMCYWRWPNQGQGYHCIFPTPSYGAQCADFANTTYDWNATANFPSKECDLAALISWHAGIAVDMNYSPTSSGSYMDRVGPALINYFRYANTTQVLNRYSNLSSWQTLIRGDLDLGEPVQYAGQSTTSGGHSWVCDGYQGTDQFHMNWGWSGMYNGWFTLNALNPGGENFNSNQQACVHIKPDPAQYPVYCTGPKVITENDFGMIEDGSGPVANYQGGSNCSWLLSIEDSVKNISLSFDRFDLNSTDYVKVYDGQDATAVLLGSFTGTALPSTVTSTGPKMFVTFTSAAGSSANGFLASYNTTLYNFCSNNSVLTTSEGNISDGSGRFQYRNGQSCRWTIQPSHVLSITLTFNNFNTEQDKDVVKVFDMANLGSPLATLSGDYSVPPSPLTSSGTGMMILFSSNNTIRDQGWDASYSSVIDATNDSRAFENLSIYPNPTEGALNLSFSSNEKQTVRIELASLQGSIVYSDSFDVSKGSVQKQIDLSSVSKGIYMLRLISDQGITNKKIFVQ